MPIHLIAEDGGKILVVHVSGNLIAADYAQLVAEFDRLLERRGKLRVLFDMTGLLGWDAGAPWEETDMPTSMVDSLNPSATTLALALASKDVLEPKLTRRQVAATEP